MKIIIYYKNYTINFDHFLSVSAYLEKVNRLGISMIPETIKFLTPSNIFLNTHKFNF